MNVNVQKGVALSILTLVLLLPALACRPILGADQLSVTAPLVKDEGGRFAEQVTGGQKLTLLTSILSGGVADRPFTAIVDVRDSAGISVHIAYVNGVAQQDGKTDVALEWVADYPDSYTIRTFILTGLDNPEILSEVKTGTISVLARSFAEISSVANFATKWDGVFYSVYFSLLDAKQVQTSHDGKASLSIADATGESRYVGSVSVAKSDFRMYERERGDGQPILAYVWKISGLEVKKGIGFGTATLTFATENDGTFSVTTPIELGQLPAEEIARGYDTNYHKFATDVDETVVEGNFKITLQSVGHFVHPAGSIPGQEVTHFRADFTITNLASQDLSTPTKYYIVDDKSVQHDEVAFNGTLQSGGTVEAFSTVSGYKLFDDISEDALWIKIVLVGLNTPEEVLEMHVTL
jgi:hypothetical protein